MVSSVAGREEGRPVCVQVIDSNANGYWEERWELYKYVYYMAIWAYDHRIQNVELYNEVRPVGPNPRSHPPAINLQWQVCCATVRIVLQKLGIICTAAAIRLVLSDL